MNHETTKLQVKSATDNSSARRKLFKLHSWVGFHLAFIMSIVLATGTIATVSNEIDWLINEELRVTPASNRVSWQTMTDSIELYAPESTIVSLGSMSGDYLPYRAVVKDEQGKQAYIYVDQWTGEVTGTTGLLTVQRFFRDLHRYLFLPNFLGLPVVTSMAFILTISLYTGLKTSRNWRTLMTRIRVRKGVRVMVGDAHKAFGLWSIWFLFLMIITSIWYLAEFGAAVSGVRFEPNRPGVAVEQLELYGNVINAHSTQDIVDAAQSAFPELNITTIRFPTRATQAITVLGKTGNPLLRSRANRVFLKPHTLEPIKIQRSENIGWVAWLNEIADPLHFGFFGGLITKLIWFFFGIALTALSFTGVWLTWKRTKTKAISRAQFATMPVLFIALLFGYFWWYQRYVPVGLPHSERILESIQQERIAITPHLGITENNEFTGKVRFLMTTENGLPNIKKASVLLVGANEKNHTTSPKVRVQRFARLSLLTFSANPEKFNEALKLTLQLEMNSKETLSFSWPLHSVEPASLSAL